MNILAGGENMAEQTAKLTDVQVNREPLPAALTSLTGFMLY